MKNALYFALGGVLIGLILTTWLAPGAIAWYFNPPIETGGFSCSVPIAWALKRLQWTQLWGIIVGGVLGLVVYGVVQKRRVRQLEQHRSGPDGGRNEQLPKS
jgi:hypothetical protein